MAGHKCDGKSKVAYFFGACLIPFAATFVMLPDPEQPVNKYGRGLLIKRMPAQWLTKFQLSWSLRKMKTDPHSTSDFVVPRPICRGDFG